MGRKVLRKVRDGLGDFPGGLGWVGGPSQWSETDRRTLTKVWDGSRDSHRMSKTCREGLRKARDGSGGTLGGQGLVWGPS